VPEASTLALLTRSHVLADGLLFWMCSEGKAGQHKSTSTSMFKSKQVEELPDDVVHNRSLHKLWPCRERYELLPKCRLIWKLSHPAPPPLTCNLGSWSFAGDRRIDVSPSPSPSLGRLRITMSTHWSFSFFHSHLRQGPNAITMPVPRPRTRGLASLQFAPLSLPSPPV